MSDYKSISQLSANSVWPLVQVGYILYCTLQYVFCKRSKHANDVNSVVFFWWIIFYTSHCIRFLHWNLIIPSNNCRLSFLNSIDLMVKWHLFVYSSIHIWSEEIWSSMRLVIRLDYACRLTRNCTKMYSTSRRARSSMFTEYLLHTEVLSGKYCSPNKRFRYDPFSKGNCWHTKYPKHRCHLLWNPCKHRSQD